MTDEAMTYCPDCDRHVPAAKFVEHREQQHPPAPIILIASGIKSEEAVHGAPPPAA